MRFLTHEQLAEIEKELSQFSYATIAEFERLFPIEKIYDRGAGKFGEYNYYMQNIHPKEGGIAVINISLPYESSYQSFWSRWNKFKNLRAFL